MFAKVYYMDTNYKKFLFYNFVSTVLISVESVITTHNVLSGVGNDESSRTMNYVGRDVIGNLGSFLFIGTNGGDADKDPKAFVNKIHMLQQSSYVLTNLASYTPSLFLPIAGSASILISISCIGFGMVNAKCIEKLSNGNTAEIYSHLALTNTIAASAGMTIGIVLTSYMGNSDHLLLCMPVLACGRIWSYNKALNIIF
jgi:hypothetical protein